MSDDSDSGMGVVLVIAVVFLWGSWGVHLPAGTPDFPIYARVFGTLIGAFFALIFLIGALTD